MLAAESRAEVRRALQRLPRRSAAVLVLRHSGLSYAEVAEAMNVSARPRRDHAPPGRIRATQGAPEMSHVPVPVLRRMQDEPLAVPDADRRHLAWLCPLPGRPSRRRGRRGASPPASSGRPRRTWTPAPSGRSWSPAADPGARSGGLPPGPAGDAARAPRRLPRRLAASLSTGNRGHGRGAARRRRRGGHADHGLRADARGSGAGHLFGPGRSPVDHQPGPGLHRRAVQPRPDHPALRPADLARGLRGPQGGLAGGGPGADRAHRPDPGAAAAGHRDGPRHHGPAPGHRHASGQPGRRSRRRREHADRPWRPGVLVEFGGQPGQPAPAR